MNYKKFINIINLNPISLIFLICILFNVFNYFFNAFFIHDTLRYYQEYKYLSDYLREFSHFPLWISQFYYGMDSLFIYLEVGFLGTLFASVAALLKINTYFSYILLISFYNFLTLYGVYLNIKNLKHNKSIIIILTLLFLFSSSNISQIHFDNIFFISIPYAFYWINKFFDNYKIINLTKVILAILVQHLIMVSYPIVTNIYICIFIFILNLFLKKISIKFFFSTNTVKDYVIFFFAACLFLIIHSLIISQYDYYFDSVAGARGGDFKVGFDVFKNLARVPYDNLIFTFLTDSFTWFQPTKTYNKDFVFSLGSLGLIAIFYFLIEIKLFFQKHIVKISILTLLIIFIISSSFFEPIEYSFYSLPGMDYYRHLSYVLNLGKPIYLIFLAVVINEVIENKNLKNLQMATKLSIGLYFLFSLLVLLIQNYHNEIQQFFSFGYKEDVFSRLSLILLFLNTLLLIIFYFLFFFKIDLFWKKICIIFSLFLIYCFNITPLKVNKEDLNDYKNLYLKNTISFLEDKVCISDELYKRKYGNLFTLVPFWTETYGPFFLMTKDKPCSGMLKWELKETKHGQVANFYKNFDLKKINNMKYLIKHNGYHIKGLLEISHNKNWIITNKNKKIYETKNESGFIFIDFESDQEVFLEYKNVNLKILIYFMFFSSLLFVAFFLFNLKKNK